jgi:histidinol dehydrogenase
MRILDATDTGALARLLGRRRAREADVEPAARRIVDDVRRRGDAALRRWAQRLDGLAGPLEVSQAELRAGYDATPADVRRAIRTAARHVRRVATRQLPRPFRLTVTPGVVVRQQVQPLEVVGCYVPGGRHPLPSTLLMTAVPARVAGVPEIVVTCAKPAPAVCAAALEAGVTRVIRVGGAQAIAALAYGTASVPRVSKIVGPGNAWVAAAKRLVSADCAVDLHAGPSEIVVWSDTGRPDWIAADLIAQAEHDPDARALLVTTRRPLARRVAAEIARRRPVGGPARLALRRNGAIIVARSRGEAAAVVNQLAPEHLVVDRVADAAVCRAAGTIFVGRWSAQAAGDYCTGSNHVLPTDGAARARGGLSAADFVRVFSMQTITRRGLAAIGPSVCALAEVEGLPAHADSIRIRRP